MLCKNCGASIMEDALRCPYCGYENENMAAKEHREEVEGIYARIAALLHMPENAVRRATRIMLKAAVAGMCVFALALFISLIYGALSPEAALKRQDAQAAELEELYQAGDYEGMYSALQKIDNSHSGVFQKYDVIGELYDTLAMAEEDCAETATFVAGFPEGADLLAYDMEYLFGVLLECGKLREAGYVYGEEKAAAEAERRARAVLTDILLLTEEEIASGVAIAGEEEADYSSLYEASAERLSGGIG